MSCARWSRNLSGLFCFSWREGLDQPFAPRRKAFRPSELPFPFLNIDTGHHFPELNEFRDRRAADLGAGSSCGRWTKRSPKGIAVLAPDQISRNHLQIPALLAAIENSASTAASAERAGTKKGPRERALFSFRDSFGQWDQESATQIWNLYNARLNPGENMRYFLSATGRKWMFGIRPQGRGSKFQGFISVTSAVACAVMANGCPSTTSSLPNPARRSRILSLGCARSATSSARAAWCLRPTMWMTLSPRLLWPVHRARFRADDIASEAAMEDRKKAGYF